MESRRETRDDLILGPCDLEDEIITADLTGTSGSVTDTTTYPVDAQAGNTLIASVDGGDEQTVTFTTAISRGRAVTTNTWPLTTQNGLTEIVTIDGGSPQTVTFSGAITLATEIAAQLDAQLSGATASVVGGQAVIYSNSKGPSSSVAIGTGTCDLTWGTPDTCNYADDVAAEINEQIVGASASVDSGQSVITSDSSGLASSVAINEDDSTSDLTWDDPVAGTGQSATWPKGTLLARNTTTPPYKLSAYSDSGANGLNDPVAVLSHELVFSVSGDLSDQVIKGGKVNMNKLSKLDDPTPVGRLVLDKLIKNTGIIPKTVNDSTVYED